MPSFFSASGLAAFALALSVPAQAAPDAASCAQPWFSGMPLPFQSAQLNADGKITFRLCAPQAREVIVTSGDAGEAIPQGFGPGTPAGLVLTRDASGLWSGTTATALKPGTYRYGFRVDGLTTADPFAERWSEARTGIAAVIEVPAAGPSPQDWQAGIPHGMVSTIKYHSAALGTLRRAHVYTPPGYMAGSQRYPVLYLVHGAGDSDDSWTSVGRADEILDALIAQGKVKPMIVVMPAGHTPDFPGKDLWTDHGFGNDLTQDLIPLVDATFRTIPDADSRAMAGLSMGGFLTLNEGLVRPATFHWIGVFSMGLGIGQSIAVDQRQVDAYVAHNQTSLTKAAKDMRLVYYAIGRQDFLYPLMGPTRSTLDRFKIAYTYHESDGGHTWSNWRDYLEDFAPRLFRKPGS